MHRIIIGDQRHFDANPQAVVEREDLGPIGPLAEQAHMADFYFPQRGVFAVGRVFINALNTTRPGSGALTASR